MAKAGAKQLEGREIRHGPQALSGPEHRPCSCAISGLSGLPDLRRCLAMIPIALCCHLCGADSSPKMLNSRLNHGHLWDVARRLYVREVSRIAKRPGTGRGRPRSKVVGGRPASTPRSLLTFSPRGRGTDRETSLAFAHRLRSLDRGPGAGSQARHPLWDARAAGG
jgi:hypothetical protein